MKQEEPDPSLLNKKHKRYLYRYHHILIKGLSENLDSNCMLANINFFYCNKSCTQNVSKMNKKISANKKEPTMRMESKINILKISTQLLCRALSTNC